MLRIILILNFLLYSCAGYELRDRENPFEVKGIKSISVPMFVNKTNLNSVSNNFSKEVISMLENFKGLKVYSGNDGKSDAVLLGVVYTADGYDPIRNKDIAFLNTEDIEKLKNRSAFTLQTIKSLDVQVRVVILKRPKKEEVDFFINYFDFNKNMFPQNVFQSNFTLSRNLFIDNSFGDSSGASNPVRGVRNKGIEISNVNQQATELASMLRSVIINAL